MRIERTTLRKAAIVLAFVLVLSPRSQASTRKTAASAPDFFCGPRCVQRTLQHYGQFVDLHDLVSRQHRDDGVTGTSMLDLTALLATRGIRTLPVILPRKIREPWPGPVIVHKPSESPDGLGHWIVVTASETPGRYSVYFGLRDVRELSWEEVVDGTSAHALLTSSNADNLEEAACDWAQPHSLASLGMAAVFALVIVAAAGTRRLGYLGVPRNVPTARRNRLALMAWPCARLQMPAIVAAVFGLLTTVLLVQQSSTRGGLEVLFERDLSAIRGGSPPPSCIISCWTVALDSQCGVGYQPQGCVEFACETADECTSELAIATLNADVHNVGCADQGQEGVDSYAATSVICSAGQYCSDCKPRFQGDNGTYCALGDPPSAGPTDTDWSYTTNPNGNSCYLAGGHPPSKAPLQLIASINGLSL